MKEEWGGNVEYIPSKIIYFIPYNYTVINPYEMEKNL